MLSLVRREPRHGWGFFNLRNEVDRMFHDSSEDSEPGENRWAPSVDIIEDDAQLVLSAEIPGVGKEDVKINLHDSVLTIEGEKRHSEKEKADNSYRNERYYGKFSRSFTLNSDIDADKIKADYKSGVLTVALPKSDKVKPRQITIN
ncbi:MAG: Hsp20/alpha crystallin family protein [candidate division Zixibacteria bacterium]|nr:Hsp20/alpha crystallin family protein [candidate division Zixibacteria bacterium]